MTVRHIGVSLGQIGHFNDGLGEFSRQVGERIAAAAPRLRELHGIEFWFHSLPELHGRFGDQVHYLPIDKWQRVLHRQPVRFDLWHNLHQLNKTRAPLGTAHRVVTVHDLNFLYFKGAYSRWRDGRRMRRMMRRTDHVVAITHYVLGDVRHHLRWTGDARVIYNGAHDLSAAPQKPMAGWPGRYLFHLSRMSTSKNIEALLALVRAWPEQAFVFAGPSGRDSRRVQSLLQQAPLPNLTLKLDLDEAEKAWAFAHCEGFLFPSLTEGFGLPPMEAMHFGKPVFLSRLTSLPEVGGEVAHYFDDFAPEAMRRTIEQGLACAAADSGYGDRVRAQAARFTWDRCARNYLAMYLELLGLDAGVLDG